MMAPDSSQSPPGRLDDVSLDAVRLALRGFLRDPEDTSALQAALLALSTEARARDILPERLLVALKEVWGTLPEVRALTDAGEQVRLLQRVVTLCIREYYGG